MEVLVGFTFDHMSFHLAPQYFYLKTSVVPWDCSSTCTFVQKSCKCQMVSGDVFLDNFSCLLFHPSLSQANDSKSQNTIEWQSSAFHAISLYVNLTSPIFQTNTNWFNSLIFVVSIFVVSNNKSPLSHKLHFEWIWIWNIERWRR